MKRSIKRISKEKISAAGKKNTRPHTAKKAGYHEEVYNSEQQNAYQKSDDAGSNDKNTSGPAS
ncbi:MAG TPA: hypothetical protein VFW07_22820 [Parafilimonas sp.]|nr:hypothetical protein [Parafilimonas sp.]